MKNYYQKRTIILDVKQLTLLIGLLLGNLYAHAQAPDFAWARQSQINNNNTLVFTRGIAHDNQGNSYVTGFFRGSVTFGSNTSTSTTLTSSGVKKNSSGSWDTYVAKYDASGNLVWTKQSGGVPFNIAVDGLGNIYITGNFDGRAKFGSTTLSTNGGVQAVFVVKYDANGVVQWAKQSNSTGIGYASASSIAVDGLSNCYITGSFVKNATFGSTTLTSNGSEDIFVAKFDPDGDEMWAKKAGGIGNDRGSSITLDGSGNSYITGSFNGSATFGSTPNNITLTSTSGGSEVFIAKLNSDNVSARYAPASAGTRSNGNVLHIHKLNAYPNPFTTKLTMELFSNTSAETAIVTLTTIAGKTVYQQEVKLTNGRVSEELDDLSRLPVGMYFLRLQLGDKPLVLKMMKQ